jgi:hypothetical protein
VLGPRLTGTLSGIFPFDRDRFEGTASPSVLSRAGFGMQGTSG